MNQAETVRDLARPNDVASEQLARSSVAGAVYSTNRLPDERERDRMVAVEATPWYRRLDACSPVIIRAGNRLRPDGLNSDGEDCVNPYALDDASLDGAADRFLGLAALGWFCRRV
jgi:hypothetical protein